MKIIGLRPWHGLARLALAGLFAASPVAVAQSAPALGQAADFAILGASAVTNTGATEVVGDLGIWPNTISSITGFPPGTVIGTVHAGNAVAQQAQSDLTAAYDDLAGRPCGTVLTDTDLGGQTLQPGVYCFATSAQLTGTLTLDALGDPDAVFIFQIGSTLTTATDSGVETINGGSICNVFWQIGSSATIGTGTALEGSILALTSITVTTGANVSGRLLASIGAVTLDTNSVGGCTAGVCPILDLMPTTLPLGTLGEAYSATVTASGGTPPYTYSVTAGAPPAGLTLDALSGELSGTPSTLGEFTFTITAVDAEGCERSRVYTLVIGAAACPAIVLDPSSLPAILLGQPYSQFIVASGGMAPYVYSVTLGALPPGLVLAADTGELSGTPTIIGSFAFTVTAVDANGCAGSQSYILVVDAPPCPILDLMPTTLPLGTLGEAYSATVTASGGTPPYTYNVTTGAPPTGLTLDALSGELSGTPSTLGDFTFTITAVDAEGCERSRVYTLVIGAAACPAIVLDPSSLPAILLGQPYSQFIVASGGTPPYVYSVTAGAPPLGLALVAGTGELSGTPTTIGSFGFTVTATDTAGCLASQIYTLVVNAPACPAIAIAPPALPVMALGVPYSQTFTGSGGTAPYTFSLTGGTLPPGLNLNPLSGVLSGTPTAVGEFNFVVTATDAAGCSSSAAFTTQVPPIAAAPLAVPTLPPWGLLLLAGCLGLIGLTALRR